MDRICTATDISTGLDDVLTCASPEGGGGCGASGTIGTSLVAPGTWTAPVRITAVREPDEQKFRYLIGPAVRERGTGDGVRAPLPRPGGARASVGFPKCPPPSLPPVRLRVPPARVMAAWETHCNCGSPLRRLGDVALYCPGCGNTWHWQGWRSERPEDFVWSLRVGSSAGSLGSSTVSVESPSSPRTSRESSVAGMAGSGPELQRPYGGVGVSPLVGDGCGSGCRLACVLVHRVLYWVLGRGAKS